MSASKYGSTDGQASTSSANQLSVPEPYQPRKNSRYEESKKIARKYKDYEEFLSTQNLLESGESSSVIDEAIPTDLREVVCRSICEEGPELPSPILSFVSAHKLYFAIGAVILLIIISIVLYYTGNGDIVVILWYKILCNLGLIDCRSDL
ncbi:hypothetical protein KL905_001133 [Ogataea polymorpha]|nr:hypothetical protein KL937_004380 [Ogataea polymorpha]KAG7896726.1 hypothetical protein KL908_000128 [Ogataea polymorpha]KAG7903471.1 hypothetical protein KL935_001003 [Ogataea polymorpha]KAG7911924.1 hypothetical protein KL906_000128 [Ogataea polymorpha]KAG7913504.1 hypothetical protein KL907_000449 [Ogataea polymorpha]